MLLRAAEEVTSLLESLAGAGNGELATRAAKRLIRSPFMPDDLGPRLAALGPRKAAKRVLAPNLGALEGRLGLPLGETLSSLIELAYRLSPEAPSNVVPFATIAGGSSGAGFWLGGPSAPTDARPIVYYHREPDQETRVVASNLRAFLGLVARWGMELMPNADLPHKEWKRAFEEQTADAMSGKRFRAQSYALCTVPGVERPAKPSMIMRKAMRLGRSSSPRSAAGAEAVELTNELAQEFLDTSPANGSRSSPRCRS